MQKIILTLSFFLAVMLILFSILQCNEHSKIITDELTYASLDNTTTYAGMNTCKECHQSIYDTYTKTGMGLSIDHASAKKSSAKFDEHALVYDKEKNFYYKPYWENDSLRFLEFRLNGSDTIYKRVETINYIIGSGQHTNSHIYNVNGYLYQAPLTFYTQKGKWDLPPGFEDGHSSRFNRIIGLECLSCHNGYPEMVLGSLNKYNAVPTGIDCERCHGPGSKHVADKRAGKLVDVSKEIDYSIVNPAKLPIDLQFDVCQRCHIQGNAVLNEGKSFYDFRPGMKLADVMNVYMPVYRGNDDEHIMASHAERLKQSKCYIKTTDKINADKNSLNKLKPFKDALTCITCHNPHVSRLETSVETFNQSCNGCHATGSKTLCTEKENVLKKNQFNCVGCHMPENKTADIPHVRVHDHRISVPVSATEKKKMKEFIGIVAINNPQPSLLSRAEAFINYYEKFSMGIAMLDSALYYIPHQTPNDIEQHHRLLIHVYYLRNDYLRVTTIAERIPALYDKLNKTSYNNSDAWTCYRIGKSYAETSNTFKAELFLGKAHSLAPLDPSFANEYGKQLAVNGKSVEAVQLFESIIAMNPKYAPPYSNLGYLYLSVKNDQRRAEELYNKALQLDPDYEAALMNKTGLLMLQQKTKEAKLLLKRILEINPGNQKAKEILMQLP